MARVVKEISLEDLYAKKITPSVEKAILLKEDFTIKAPNWCEKVCKLKNKNPPCNQLLVPTEVVDVLIIQDYKAFDEPRFKRRGEEVERSHRDVIAFLASTAFKETPDHPRLTYALTNLLKCGLRKEDITKGKPPTEAIMSKCRPYLLKEIELRKPKAIISLHTSVTKALGLKMTNYGNRGEIAGIVVLTLHPRILLMLRQNASGKMWGPDYFRIILRDFRKAAGIARGELNVPTLEDAISAQLPFIRVAGNLDDVREFCKELTDAMEAGSVASYDTETTSLDPWGIDSKIILMQFGYRDQEGKVQALVFPMWHRDNTFYDPDEAFRFISPLLENPGYKKIGQNIKFDVLFTYACTGVRINGILFDTMLLQHHLDSGTQGCYSLKTAVSDYLPHLGLAKYETKLPGLTSKVNIAKADARSNPEEYDDDE